ncbi:Uncharacterised protein [Candidatus Venteria ishoeyi]|uniref:Uncharacterized protein n=1 Tax=Candidatus Venteria ishoeyi TaxID=1899563 RepID=A0A1H6F573_9GAMM|nr:Uncharacterised protein [Candidatus Venteria ishoeyi]
MNLQELIQEELDAVGGRVTQPQKKTIEQFENEYAQLKKRYNHLFSSSKSPSKSRRNL